MRPERTALSTLPWTVPAPPPFLASDLDGTLIPPSTVPGDGGIQELRHALLERGARVAYVTGRHLRLAMLGIEQHALPLPEMLVCDVGTSVYVRRGDHFEPDPRYRELMASAAGGTELAPLARQLESIDALKLQEEEKQADFKLSYYTPSGTEGAAAAAHAARILAEADVSVNVVYSVDPVKDAGLVDILPAGVAKDTALRYLHDRSGVPQERLVYAGDSGNDRAAMLSGYNVVVVGNAPDPFKQSIRREAEERDLSDRIYIADASYAGGVLEGCRHFGII